MCREPILACNNYKSFTKRLVKLGELNRVESHVVYLLETAKLALPPNLNRIVNCHTAQGILLPPVGQTPEQRTAIGYSPN